MIPLRLCLFDRTADAGLRSAVHQLSDVHVVAQIENWDAFQALVTSAPVDTVVLHLDPTELANSFLLTQQVRELAPAIRIVGACGDHSPETIIHAMRAGCSQFVRMPADIEDLRAAVESTRRADSPPGQQVCHRVCVMAASGGAGATTIASNIALELAGLTRNRVALIDMNAEFADVACYFDAETRCGISDVCKPDVDIDATLVQSALTHMDSGVSLLSKPAQPGEHEVDARQVERLFDVLSQNYNFVIADLPRSFTPPVLAVLGGAERVVLVAQLAVPFLRNARRILDHLLHMGANKDHIEIVINRSNASYEMITFKEVADHFGKPVFGDVPNDYKRLTSVRDLGSSLAHDAPNSPARLGMHRLAQRLLEAPGGNPASIKPANGGASSPNATGIFQRLLGRGVKAKR